MSVPISITKTSPAYADILNIVTSVAGVAIAIAYRTQQPTNYNHGDFLGFSGRATSKSVRFPLFGPIEVLLSAQVPDVIELTIEDTASLPSFQAQVQLSNLGQFFDALVFPRVVSYFQRDRSRLEQRFSQDRTKWPLSWQMAWAVRNAASHGGVAFQKPTQKPVTWRGVSFGPADEPAKSLLTMMSGGDLALLMLDMADDLP